MRGGGGEPLVLLARLALPAEMGSQNLLRVVFGAAEDLTEGGVHIDDLALVANQEAGHGQGLEGFRQNPVAGGRTPMRGGNIADGGRGHGKEEEKRTAAADHDSQPLGRVRRVGDAETGLTHQVSQGSRNQGVSKSDRPQRTSAGNLFGEFFLAYGKPRVPAWAVA